MKTVLRGGLLLTKKLRWQFVFGGPSFCRGERVCALRPTLALKRPATPHLLDKSGRLWKRLLWPRNLDASRLSARPTAVTFTAFRSSCDPYRDLAMKQTNYRFTRKRKIWSARLEILSRRAERWLEEHYKQAFFWFMMLLLFITQVLLWLV